MQYGGLRTFIYYFYNSFPISGTYIVFRIGVLAWMTRWVFLNHQRVPLVLYAIGSLGLAIMTIMNIVLFYRLIRSDFLKPRDKKQA